MMSSGQLNSATGQSVTCIIADGSMSFPIDVGNELGIPVIHFRTISACSFWAYFCIQDMIEAGELPIRGNLSQFSLWPNSYLLSCLHKKFKNTFHNYCSECHYWCIRDIMLLIISYKYNSFPQSQFYYSKLSGRLSRVKTVTSFSI